MEPKKLLLTSAVLLMASPALAEPLVLEDDQLDQIAAGAGQGVPAHDHANEVQVVVFMPNGLFNHITHSTGTDINTHVVPSEGVFVINPSGEHGTIPPP
jgi:hypothetical protein